MEVCVFWKVKPNGEAPKIDGVETTVSSTDGIWEAVNKRLSRVSFHSLNNLLRAVPTS